MTRPSRTRRAARIARLALIACLAALMVLAPPRAGGALAQTGPGNAPTLTADTAATYSRGGGPVIVSPGLEVVGSGTIAGAAALVADNFAPGDTLGIQGQSGGKGTIEGFDWSYSGTTGVLTLSGSAPAANLQAALRQITFRNTDPAASVAARTVRFSLGRALPNPANGHYYEFVAQPSVAWSTAGVAAAGRSFFGRQGYLATITDAAENTFVASRVAGQGWLGASDDPSQGASEGHWIWTGGPEAGDLFFIDDSGPVGSAYTSWAPNEPGSATGENFGRLLAGGLWGAEADSTLLDGYLVEYGGLPDDPALQISDDTTVSLGLTAPTLHSLPPINSANVGAYPVSGECLAGANVTVSVGGTSAAVSCPASRAYSVALDVRSVADGPSVPVTARQSDGTLTSGQASGSVAKDTAVGAPTIASPPPINAANNSAYPVDGVCEPGAAVAISVGGTGAAATCASSGTYSATLDLSALPDGDGVPIRVAQTDTAGNASGPADASVLKDTLVPAVTVATAGDLRSGTPVISGTAEPGALVTVEIVPGSGTAAADGPATFLATAGEDSVWTLDLAADTPDSGRMPSGGLTPGRTAQISATATDAAGNTGAADSQTVFVLPLLYLPSVTRTA